jgi:hypothetical protein
VRLEIRARFLDRVILSQLKDTGRSPSAGDQLYLLILNLQVQTRRGKFFSYCSIRPKKLLTFFLYSFGIVNW